MMKLTDAVKAKLLSNKGKALATKLEKAYARMDLLALKKYAEQIVKVSHELSAIPGIPATEMETLRLAIARLQNWRSSML